MLNDVLFHDAADRADDARRDGEAADLLPLGLTLLNATPSQGSYAGGVWTAGTVSPGTPLTLTLTARVDGQNALTNTATISHSDQFDPDSTNRPRSFPC